MTISESLGFTYNNIHSSEFGLIKISTSSGLFDESFLPNRSIIEEKIFDRDEPYFFGFEYEPAEVPVSFYFEDKWNEVKINKIVNWLVQPYYCPLYFDTDTSRIFYCVYHGDPRILHNGLKNGYVNITMRCNSAFSYTPVYKNSFIVDTESEPMNIEIANIGHKISYPIVIIEKIGDGDVSIVNYSNGGIESKIIDLLDKEIVVIDSFNEEITTDLEHVYRYGNFNNNFLKFVTGINRLSVKGNCRITFEYQSKRYI
ncbi:phage tail domain-containing protein [Robertmurraya siralis]|uniref:phage tail domain-containing protein n=1 Tax=Robertmurraya siralis TaxID=77777 RepID=UPI0010F4D241|nr:phage tail domain-containing protein [Robertmurraya siralis]